MCATSFSSLLFVSAVSVYCWCCLPYTLRANITFCNISFCSFCLYIPTTQATIQIYGIITRHTLTLMTQRIHLKKIGFVWCRPTKSIFVFFSIFYYIFPIFDVFLDWIELGRGNGIAKVNFRTRKQEMCQINFRKLENWKKFI